MKLFNRKKKPKFRIVRYYDEDGNAYYVVERRRILFGWYNVFTSWIDDVCISYRTFKNQYDAEKALNNHILHTSGGEVIKEYSCDRQV